MSSFGTNDLNRMLSTFRQGLDSRLALVSMAVATILLSGCSVDSLSYEDKLCTTECPGNLRCINGKCTLRSSSDLPTDLKRDASIADVDSNDAGPTDMPAMKNDGGLVVSADGGLVTADAGPSTVCNCTEAQRCVNNACLPIAGSVCLLSAAPDSRNACEAGYRCASNTCTPLGGKFCDLLNLDANASKERICDEFETSSLSPSWSNYSGGAGISPVSLVSSPSSASGTKVMRSAISNGGYSAQMLEHFFPRDLNGLTKPWTAAHFEFDFRTKSISLSAESLQIAQLLCVVSNNYAGLSFMYAGPAGDQAFRLALKGSPADGSRLLPQPQFGTTWMHVAMDLKAVAANTLQGEIAVEGARPIVATTTACAGGQWRIQLGAESNGATVEVEYDNILFKLD